MHTVSFEIEHYITPRGIDCFTEWFESLTDIRLQAAVLLRLSRVRAGALGDCKPISDGVWELRLDIGPGYRLYYARAGMRLILLLTAGTKRNQRADIERALRYWNDWKQRSTS